MIARQKRQVLRLTPAFGPVFAAFIAVAVIQPHHAGAEVLNLVAVEDSWINGLASTTTHGNDADLGICPVADYWIYLKFDVSALAGRSVQSAELRMSRFSGNRPEEISLYHIPDDSWSEATLNGQTRPVPTDPQTADALGTGQAATGYDRWSPAGLAALVEQEANGDGILSVMLREDPDPVIDVRRYYSREGASSDAEKPQLFLDLQAGETVAAGWAVEEVGLGVKPSFDFDASGRIHLMAMTETGNGHVWHLQADGITGPWTSTTVATGYFYGPGDLHVDTSGTAHLAWHDHDAQNPGHGAVDPAGIVTLYPIDTPASHDGWDNSLAIGPQGQLHQASVFPSAFGALDSLQYGVFDGADWTYERNVPGSGSFMYGLNTSIAVDTSGNPHIAYCGSTDWTTPGDLMYATRSGDTWAISAVTTGGIRGRFPSLALDHWDRPHVAWLDIDSSDTSHAFVRYGVLNSNVWEIETVDELTSVTLSHTEARKSVSLALDGNWRPHLAYADKRVIRYAHKPFGDWQITTVLKSGEDLYKGLVVLRLDRDDEPTFVFWQRNDPEAGLIRIAQPERESAARQNWPLYR